MWVFVDRDGRGGKGKLKKWGRQRGGCLGYKKGGRMQLQS